MSNPSNEQFLPFSRPTINRAAIDEVVACLESGWITTGPRVKKFEEDLKTYVSAPHVLALTSATAGLHLALLALGLKKDDEVITTPMTFAATLTPSCSQAQNRCSWMSSRQRITWTYRDSRKQ
jgi:dTDP-4-amino-4,6-dideoxygalactose transaminase